MSGLFLVFSRPSFHRETFREWSSSPPSKQAPSSAEHSASAEISAALICGRGSTLKIPNKKTRFFNSFHEWPDCLKVERRLPLHEGEGETVMLKITGRSLRQSAV